jgi:hypothetical protein
LDEFIYYNLEPTVFGVFGIAKIASGYVRACPLYPYPYEIKLLVNEID